MKKSFLSTLALLMALTAGASPALATGGGGGGGNPVLEASWASCGYQTPQYGGPNGDGTYWYDCGHVLVQCHEWCADGSNPITPEYDLGEKFVTAISQDDASTKCNNYCVEYCPTLIGEECYVP